MQAEGENTARRTSNIGTARGGTTTKSCRIRRLETVNSRKVDAEQCKKKSQPCFKEATRSRERLKSSSIRIRKQKYTYT